MESRNCKVCGKFINKGTLCGACCVKEARRRRKERAVEYKGGKCEICGYDDYMEALTFHHLNPDDKEFGIGDGGCRSWEIIKKELDKCALLCYNCHSEIHAEIRNVTRYPGKKHISIRNCKQCGTTYKPTYSEQKYCSYGCTYLARRTVARPSIDKLVKLVEELGYCAVGRKFGVSDNAIKKWIHCS